MRCSLPGAEALPQWKWKWAKLYWLGNPPPVMYGMFSDEKPEGRLTTTVSGESNIHESYVHLSMRESEFKDNIYFTYTS